MVDKPNPDGVSRRRFLLTTGVVGAGALGARMSPWSAAADPGAPPYPPQDCGNENDTDSLWKDVKGRTPQVHGPHQTVVQPDPKKNAYVVQSGNEPNQNFKYNLLVIPVARVTGVECGRIIGDSLLNLWPYAFKEAQNAFPGKDVIAGINSLDGRTKNQLHIHLTQFYAPARKVLDGLKISSNPADWNAAGAMHVLPAIPQKKGDPPGAYAYRILHVDSLDSNLFALMKAKIATAANDMFAQSLGVVTAPKGGYYLINTQGRPSRSGQPAHAPLLEVNKTYGTQTVEGLFYRGDA